jgi:hypothetical protein
MFRSAHSIFTARFRARWLAAGFAGLIIAQLPSVLAQDTPPSAVTQAQPEAPAVVQVTGVETLVDYATVGRLLGTAEGVRRVDVTEAAGVTVTFRVLVRGGSAALERALESSTQLARGSDASSDTLVYEFRR